MSSSFNGIHAKVIPHSSSVRLDIFIQLLFTQETKVATLFCSEPMGKVNHKIGHKSAVIPHFYWKKIRQWKIEYMCFIEM